MDSVHGKRSWPLRNNSMKSLYKSLRAVLFGALLLTGGNAFAQGTTEVQVVNNIPDPALTSIDIFVNGIKLVPSLGFRQATATIPVPLLGSRYRVAIAPGGSLDTSAALFKGFITLLPNRRYVLVAQGLRTTAGFKANPTGANIGLQVIQKNVPKTSPAGTSGVTFINGSTDSDSLAIRLRLEANSQFIVSGLGFGDTTGNITLGKNALFLDLVTQSGIPRVSNSFLYNFFADSLKFNTLIISGFSDSAANQNGPSLVILVVRADGTVTTLRPIRNSAVQFIHNSPDPSINVLDVYINGVRVADNVTFRNSTVYLPIPVLTPVKVVIARGNSTSDADSLKAIDFNIIGGTNIIAIANGLADTVGYARNPDGNDLNFNVSTTFGRVFSTFPNGVDLKLNQGSPDLGQVTAQLVEANNAIVFRNYGHGTTTLTYEPINGVGKFTFDFIDAFENDLQVTIGSDYTQFANRAIVMLLSGFADPTANKNGPGLALFFVRPEGTSSLAGIKLPNVNSKSTDVSLQAYPNPALGSTQINYTLALGGNVTLNVIDLAGRVQYTQNYGYMPSGQVQLPLNLSSLASGIYEVQLVSGPVTAVQKLIVR